MAVRALGTYDFPPKEPREDFGTDLLIYTYFEGNSFFVAPSAWRVPADMPWEAFRAGVLDPWLGADPDFDPAMLTNWRNDDVPFEPKEGATLDSLGIGWKSVIRFNH